jgi:hypothetical protein
MLRRYIASETNKEAASIENQAEAKTNVVYFNDGCAVKRENLDIPGAKTRRLRPKPIGAGLNLGLQERNSQVTLTSRLTANCTAHGGAVAGIEPACLRDNIVHALVQVKRPVDARSVALCD